MGAISPTLESCFRDVGLNSQEQISKIEARAKASISSDENGGQTLRDSDRHEALSDLLSAIWESVYEHWSEPLKIGDQLATLRQSIQEFRQESAEQHGEILEQLGQLRGQLVDRLKVAGLPAEQAEQMTDPASETFLQRVRRWASNQQARDTAEAALWAALDFVPGGTGVKLGIKVASAIRRATKKQHVP